MPLVYVIVCGSLVPFWRVEDSTLNKDSAFIMNPSVGGQPRTDYVHMLLHALYSGESGFTINYLTLCAPFFLFGLASSGVACFYLTRPLVVMLVQTCVFTLLCGGNALCAETVGYTLAPLLEQSLPSYLGSLVRKGPRV